MTASRDYLARSHRAAVIISTVSILIFIFTALLIGLRYETKKFKVLITTMILVLIYQFFFADAVLMLVKAIVCAVRVQLPWTGAVNPAFVGGPNRKEYLQRRIAALKAQLELGPTFYKRNEAMTQKYKEVFNDIVLFGSYFAILLVLIVGTRDPLAYYNTRTIKDVLRNPKFSYFALENVVMSDDLYNFINGTLVRGFNDGTSYNGQPFAESGWVDEGIAKLLGVIRLRQIRHRSLNETLAFETGTFWPGWMKDMAGRPYKEKFWRMFKPWEHQTDVQTGGVDRVGKLYHQPGGGYVALLGRNIMNSERVLEFLRSNSWIDSYTAVIVIEFTLYNVDADIFTLVTISGEQSAFDSFVMSDRIDTVKLLFNIDNLPWYTLLAFLFYFFVLMEVVAYVVVRMWYSPSVRHYLSMSWNYVDITIVCLNIFIVIGVWTREVYVKALLYELETTKKNHFVPFYRAALIDETCTVLVAFLVALTTLRMWKILQFATVFRVLTSTLHHAKKSLMSTTFFIFIFIMGIGIGSYIINGSNSEDFVEFLICLSSLMSLSFGFTANVTPKEMNYGGRVLGFVLYLVLAIVVTVFLLNMFITVLCLHLYREKEKDLEKAQTRDYYTFWHFLERELAEKFRWLSGETKKKKTQNTRRESILRLRGGGGRFGKPKEANPNSSEQMRRMQLISEILDTQMELLRETMNSDREEVVEDECSPGARDEEEVHSQAEPVDETSKNSQQRRRTNIPGIQPQTSVTAIRSA